MVAFGKDFDYPGKPIRVVISEEEGQDMLLALAHEKLMRILDQAADAGKGFGEIATLLGLTRKELLALTEALKHGRHAVAATKVGRRVYEMLLDIEDD
jgi:hypothetical protein